MFSHITAAFCVDMKLLINVIKIKAIDRAINKSMQKFSLSSIRTSTIKKTIVLSYNVNGAQQRHDNRFKIPNYNSRPKKP